MDLDWEDAAGAECYDIYFGTTNPPPLVANSTASLNDPGTLSYETTYYWRIISRNDCGDTPGSVWSFTTIACPTPGIPSNPMPGHNSSGVSTTSKLAWTASSNADSYDVYFGTENPPPLLDNTTNTSYPLLDLNTNTVYYWKIVAKNMCVNSIAGPVWSFTTICPLPGPISHSTPSNGAVDQSRDTDLVWEDSSDATSYDIYFGMVNPPPFLVNRMNTSLDLWMLDYGTMYYWKVVAKNVCGETPNTVWSFTTIPCSTPGIPLNPSPSDTLTGVSTNPTLSWEATSDTDSYDAYFGMTNPPPFVGHNASPSHPLTGLNTNTTYYWRIVARNNCGNSTSGRVWSFTTICPLPGDFVYVSPSNGSLNQSINTDLDWVSLLT